MAAEQDTDPYCTPVRHDHQRNHRSLCTPPRKPSAKHGRNVADAPDTNVITKRTSRRVRRALAFTGIATPPLSAKSRAAILSALRGRGASMRLDFDAVCPDAVGDPAGQPYMQDCGVDDAKVGDAKVGEGKVGDGKVGDGKVGDGKVPAGSVTPPPVMTTRYKRRKLALAQNSDANIPNPLSKEQVSLPAFTAGPTQQNTTTTTTTTPRPSTKTPKPGVATRSTALASKPNTHGRIRRLWR